MQLLATLKAEDVEDNPPTFDYESFKPRLAARAIVFDGDKVALIRIGKHDYYMLPGGGIDDEDIAAGLARELLEELGCTITITGEIGQIITYVDRWLAKQTDFCYTAQKIGETSHPARTEFEAAERHEVVWAESLAAALQLVEAAHPQNRDGKLVGARDALFLRTAING